MSQAEKIMNEFKPVTYDVNAQVKAIESFESVAVKQAQESSAKLEAELKDLKETLNNIEGARPFEEMVKKGKWTVPGYDEKFGNLAIM